MHYQRKFQPGERVTYSPIIRQQQAAPFGSNSNQVNRYIDSPSEEEQPRAKSAVNKDLNYTTNGSNKQQWRNSHSDYRPYQEARSTSTPAKIRPARSDLFEEPLDISDYRHEQFSSPTFRESDLNETNLSPNGEQQLSSENGESELEEVYLCNCCGITKELKPAMKYMSVFRSLFHLFNFLSFIFAFALLGFGLWYRIDPKVYELHKYIETQNFTIAGWIMLFGGFSVCLLVLIGCRSVGRQQICGLLLYCITMTLITLAFIGSLVLLTVHGLGTTLERFMSKEIYDQIRRRAMSNELDLYSSYEAVQFLDFVQVKLRCCGSIDFRDYQKLGMVIPATCYTIAGNYVNAPGCAQAIREMFDLRAGLAAGFTAAGVISQLLATTFGALIVCSIYNHRANPPRRPIASATNDPQEPIVKTPVPAQFDKMATARARDYETQRTSRPDSRSSMTSIRV